MSLTQTVPALSWRDRAEVVAKPVRTGAESFSAGTASSPVRVSGVDELYDEMSTADVLHPVSRERVDDTDSGPREFATLDLDGNLVTFFEWRSE